MSAFGAACVFFFVPSRQDPVDTVISNQAKHPLLSALSILVYMYFEPILPYVRVLVEDMCYHTAAL